VAGTKRERQLARERYERQQARRAAERAKARRRQQVVGAVLGVLAVIAGVFFLMQLVDDDEVTTTSAQPSAQPKPTEASVCEAAPSGATKPQQFAKEPPLTLEPTKYTAKLATNCGEIVLELDAAKAPRAVNSFVFLAGKGYFKNSPCHRLTTSGIFVLQCGDPSGTGSGGPGYKFVDENLPKAGGNNYPVGTVAMANSGKGTNGSQFFLVYKDTTLPPNYTVFGRVAIGQHVLDKVRFAGVEGDGGDGAPKVKISILDVTTTKGAA
jgi:peptidyl-prolyl cis-trans isomerase B (cyclophilin B)